MGPTKLEKAFVQFLTVIYWWIESRLNKSILWYSFAVNFLVVFFFNITFYMLIELSYDMLLRITIDTFAAPVIFYLFAGARRDKYGIIKNTKMSPNPNIYGKALFKARLQIICFFTLIPMLWQDNWFYLVVVLSVSIGFYALCVEPLPPYKKRSQFKENPTLALEGQ